MILLDTHIWIWWVHRDEHLPARITSYLAFHSRFRDECLALEVFDSLRDARAITAAWEDDYNHRRPHGSLGFQTPADFAAACAASASAKASAPAAHAAVCLGQTQP